MSNVFDFPSRDMDPAFADPESVARPASELTPLDEKMDIYLDRITGNPADHRSWDYQDAIFSSISADAWPDEINYAVMARKIGSAVFNNDAKELGELLIKYARPWLIEVLEDEID